ncbi:MAG: chromosome segregation protein SMC, partial [Nitrospirae bacterium]
MELHTLRLTGFKSFPNATLEFPKGITAFVGPNGSGKSNIVDAILWVLGEQSVKALRGERMEDVIFNGTESRKPLSMAEVSLVLRDVTSQEFQALAGVLDKLPGSKELMVTRRLYRDGTSEYSVNNIPCRLKDVRALFLEARAGTKGHTVIEQGNIEQILSGSPQDRRTFIEETAGIGRFKKQRLEALRKLQTTQQHLLRVRDIVAEVRKQRRSLERQAREAQAYHELRQEARELEVRLLQYDHRRLTAERVRLDHELRDHEAREMQQRARESELSVLHQQVQTRILEDGAKMGELEVQLRTVQQRISQALTTLEVERQRWQMYHEQRQRVAAERERVLLEAEDVNQALAQCEERLALARTQLSEQDRTLRHLESQEEELERQRDLLHDEGAQARQRVLELTAHLSRAEQALVELGAREVILGEHLESLRDIQARYDDQLQEVEQKLSACSSRRHALNTEKAALHEAHHQSVQTVQALGQRLDALNDRLRREHTDYAAADSRLQALRATLDEELGYGRHGALFSLREECGSVKASIAEGIEVPQEIELAIEAALGEKLRAWMIDSLEEVERAIAFLESRRLGRGTFVLSQPSGPQPDPCYWPELCGQEGVIGRACDLVRVSEDLRPALACLLAPVVVVRDLQTALRLLAWLRGNERRKHEQVVLVTLAGEILDPVGVITGGSSGDTVGLLQRKREIRELAEDCRARLQRIELCQQEQQQVIKDCDLAKRQALEVEHALERVERELATVDKELAVLEQTRDDLNQKLGSTQEEYESTWQERQQVHDSLESWRHRRVDVEQERERQQKALEALEDSSKRVDTQIGEVAKQLTALRVMLGAMQERCEHDQRELQRLSKEHMDQDRRLSSLVEQLHTLEAQMKASHQQVQETEEALQGLERERDAIQAEWQVIQDRHAGALLRVRELERQLSDLRKQFLATREQRGVVEVRLAELRTKLVTLEETLTGTYNQTPDTDIPLAFPNEQTNNQEPESWRQRLEEIRLRLDRMGPVNLAAVDEHRQLEERYQFLTKQEADLSESIRSLQEIIERLNRKTHRMFEETFNALQEKFGEVFRALFAGGQAELRLVHSDPEQDDQPWEEPGVEPGVEIVAQPPGKRLKNLAMLSGGEKALTVLALLFASFLIKPSPFCILDEVDAPLDEPNVVRFARFLRQIADQSQFLVITHNKRTME